MTSCCFDSDLFSLEPNRKDSIEHATIVNMKNAVYWKEFIISMEFYAKTLEVIDRPEDFPAEQ